MSPAPHRPDRRPNGFSDAEKPAPSGPEIAPKAQGGPAAVRSEEDAAGAFQEQLENARRLFALERDVAEARRQLAEANVKITEAQLVIAEKELEALQAENERLRQEIEALRTRP